MMIDPRAAAGMTNQQIMDLERKYMTPQVKPAAPGRAGSGVFNSVDRPLATPNFPKGSMTPVRSDQLPGGPRTAPSYAQPAVRPPLMSIDEFSRSSMMRPSTQEYRNPVDFEGSMRDPELVRQYEQYRSGQMPQPAVRPPLNLGGPKGGSAPYIPDLGPQGGGMAPFTTDPQYLAQLRAEQYKILAGERSPSDYAGLEPMSAPGTQYAMPGTMGAPGPGAYQMNQPPVQPGMQFPNNPMGAPMGSPMGMQPNRGIRSAMAMGLGSMRNRGRMPFGPQNIRTSFMDGSGMGGRTPQKPSRGGFMSGKGNR